MPRLTRAFLRDELGIEEEDTQNRIIGAHREAVDALIEQRDKAEAEVEKLAEVQKELDTLKAKGTEDSSYKEKYEKLDNEFKEYKADISKKEALANNTAKYKSLLLKAGIAEKYVDSVLKVTDISKVTFSDSGEIKDEDKEIAKIKEDWKDFIPVSTGANTPNPMKNSSTGKDKNAPASRAASVAEKFYGVRYGLKNDGGDKK